MRVAHLVNSLQVGGLERVVIELAKFQSGQNNKVFVICLFDAMKDYVLELKRSGIEVYFLRKDSAPKHKVLFLLKKFLTSEKIHILHTHNPVPNLYGVIISKFVKNLVVINTRHGMGDFPFDAKREKLYFLSSIFTKKIICVCNAARESFIQKKILSARKTEVIYNGIELKGFFKAKKTAHNFKKEFDVKDGCFIIGTVARLVPEKDLSTLLEAFSIFKYKSQAIVLIVGDGPERDGLLQVAERLGISSRVIFMGQRKDIPDLLSMFDVFVLPSLTEGLSLTIIEAMAAKKPVIATNVGGNGEIVIHGRTGFIVPVQSPAEIANELICLYEDSALRLKMGKEGRERALKVFDVSVMAQRYHQIYQEITSEI